MNDYSMNQEIEADTFSWETAHKLLEALVVENADLEKLESLLAQFNIFEAVGVVRQEERHSDFLAFLLNPRAAHGLGDVFLKKLLQKSLSGLQSSMLPVSPIDFDIWNLNAAIVQREWHNIDILITDETYKIAIIIENKVDSNEHSDQLNRYWRDVQEHYPSWNIVGLFLSPEGQTATHEQYVTIDYALICSLVESLAVSHASTLGPDVHVLMMHYVQMLRRRILNDSDIAQLCRRIYFKHQKALDLILDHRPDLQTQISETLKSLIENESDLVLDYSSKSKVCFALSAWDITALRGGIGWTRSGRMLLFEFQNQNKNLELKLIIGPGDEGKLATRQQIFNMAMVNGAPFKPATRMRDQWNQIYKRNFVTFKDYENQDFAEIENKLREQWSRFVHEDLLAICSIIKVDELQTGDPRENMTAAELGYLAVEATEENIASFDKYLQEQLDAANEDEEQS